MSRVRSEVRDNNMRVIKYVYIEISAGNRCQLIAIAAVAVLDCGTDRDALNGDGHLHASDCT